MNLKEKLQLIESFSKAFRPIDEPSIKHGIEQFMEGEEVATPYGPCFVKTMIFDGAYYHGSISVTRIDYITSKILSSLGKDETLRMMDLKKTLFFDTETTGLSSGAGTYIFLAGFDYFENDRLIIKQFFLRDFDEELAFLYAVNELLKNFSGIISYNGKAYDWPLLQNRFIFSRLNCELNAPLHLDLLYTARRIWKRRLADCSLENIERHVLNFHRVNDIPGSLIPQVYFQYLRDKNPQPLIRIFQHNVLDILSMVTLLSKLSQIFQAPFNYLQERDDLISLAHTFENMKQWRQSITIYEKLLRQYLDRETKGQIALRLSYCYKRLEMWQQAVLLWQNMITDGFNNIEPYIELAKYYEHRICDYKNATEIVIRSLKVLEIAEQLWDDFRLSSVKQELNHRLSRITQKQRRREGNE